MIYQHDFGRLDKESYSILVLWLAGYPTDAIAAIVNVTSGKVRGVARTRESGGKMPKPRDELSKEDRQELLDDLKGFRIDDDFLKPMCFIAHDLSPKQATRQGRKDAHNFRKSLSILLSDAQVRREERERGGNEKRGDRAHPILFLSRAGKAETKLLDDPEDVVKRLLKLERETKKSQREVMSPLARRFETAKWLRKIMEDGQISGFKEISMEVSTGGMGMPITERFVAARSALRAIQDMMPEELYAAVLVPVIMDDAFIWEVPSSKARALILEDIRRAIDIASIYRGSMSGSAYEARWELPAPQISRAKGRDDARETVRLARELIQEGVRQS